MARISHRPKILLTNEENEYLIKLSHSGSQLASIVERAKILAYSKNNTEISRELNFAHKIVRNRIQRVLDHRVKENLSSKLQRSCFKVNLLIFVRAGNVLNL